MNKAFVREPDFDGRVFCPRCGSQALAIGSGPLDQYLTGTARRKFAETAYCCEFSRCDVVYFQPPDIVAMIDDLRRPAYPYDLDAAPLCACFGLNYDDIESDVRDGQPTRIRELLAKSKSTAAHCAALALDGRCCLTEVQRLYMKLRQAAE